LQQSSVFRSTAPQTPLSNAALVWNTVKIMEIVDRLEMNGEIVSREALSKVLPLCFEHIIPTETYNFIR
jgi:hypothetical protein